MPDEPSRERAGSWQPRGIAMSLLVSMGAWLFFGTPGGDGGEPVPQEAGGWQVIPGDDADEARCRYPDGWAALEYQGEQATRVAEDLSVQPGERWEFEDAWEATNTLWALVDDPVAGSPQEEMTDVELAEHLRAAPSNWTYGERTSCVALSGAPQGPPR